MSKLLNAIVLWALMGAFWGTPAGWSAELSSLTSKGSTYIIGPNDELEISVIGYPELSLKTVVLPDGYISYAFSQKIKAAGLAPDALSRAIERSLDSYIYSPKVTVTLTQMRSNKISVLGEVKKPGVFFLTDSTMTIYEAIALAEGFSPSALSKEVHVLRAHGLAKRKVFNLDLADAVDGKAEAVNFKLRSGDVVYVPGKLDRSNRISVLGDVKKPGVLFLEDMNMTVYEAIAQAEGFLPTAFPQQVSVLRADGSGHQTSVNVDLASTASGKIQAVTLKLKPGDIIYVPGQSDKKQVCVIGKVLYPGRYNISSGMTAIDVLTSAGWIAKGGVATSVILVRRGDTDREFIRINAQAAVERNDLSQDMLLNPGDIIYVPETFISKLSNFVGFFSSTVEPMAHTYLRVYDAVNPANVVVDR